MTANLEQLVRQLPKPDPSEELRVRAIDFARLLALALDFADDDLDEKDRELLDSAGDYLGIHAPTTARWHSERRRFLDGWGQPGVEADQHTTNPGF